MTRRLKYLVPALVLGFALAAVPASAGPFDLTNISATWENPVGGTSVTYAPPAGYSGTDTFRYALTDAGDTMSGTVTDGTNPVQAITGQLLFALQENLAGLEEDFPALGRREETPHVKGLFGDCNGDVHVFLGPRRKERVGCRVGVALSQVCAPRREFDRPQPAVARRTTIGVDEHPAAANCRAYIRMSYARPCRSHAGWSPSTP